MLKYFTTLVAAITPLMYFHGVLFHDSYLRALGIPPDLFRLNFEDALVQGFVAYMLLSIPYLLLLSMYLAVAWGVAYNLNEATKINFIKRVGTWVANRLENSNIHDKTQGHYFTERAFKWVSYLLTVVIGLLIVLGASLGIASNVEELGKGSANNNVKGINKNLILQELHLSNGSSIKGYTLECSNYGCAVYADKKIQIIPLAEIERIDALINRDSK